MKMLVTKMAFATSVALATLIAGEAAYAQARYHDRGTAIDSQARGQVGGGGPRVTVQRNDVVVGGRVIGADPDPFIRQQLRRDYDLQDR
jgi:hypothetical protein